MNEFIEWNSLGFKKNKGAEQMTCPKCSHERKKKTQKCLTVYHDSGVAKCYHCEALSFRDSEPKKTRKTYELPSQEWQNYTSLSDKMVKWVNDERKIRQETLIHFGITEEKHYQPQAQKEMNNIVFNYFEGKTVVNKKYRSGQKHFTQSKGGKPILYNVNSAIGSDEVWIVEGELDVLALYEVGIKSAVSLPMGANDSDDQWINSEPYLKDVKKFIIATDNDEKGIEVRDKIAQRLGRWRCEYVELENKDANGDLIGGVLRKTIKELKRFPVGGTFTVDDLYDGIIGLYDEGLPKTIKIENKAFGNLNDVWTTMRGHLITTTGIPSHGKSSYLEWYALNLVNEHKMKMSLFSPEHSPMSLHHSKMAEKVVGKPFYGQNRMERSAVDRYRKWANEKIYLTGAENGEFPTWNWLFDKFKEQLFTFGIDIFVVDAFNKLEFDEKGDERLLIRKVLTKLTMFAQMHNVLIFLIAHPTKMSKKEDGTYSVPTLYDVSGTADFRNQTHDGITIHRHFGNEIEQPYTLFVNTKTKFSFQGEIGAELRFNYDASCGRYYAQGCHPDKSDWTEIMEETQSDFLTELNEIKPAITPNVDFDTFGIEDDCPF